MSYTLSHTRSKGAKPTILTSVFEVESKQKCFQLDPDLDNLSIMDLKTSLYIKTPSSAYEQIALSIT